MKCKPTEKKESRIVTTLNHLCNEGHLDAKLCDFRTLRYSSTPQIYGLPKVDKEDTRVRPIVSALVSSSYNCQGVSRRPLAHTWKHPPYSEELCSIHGLNKTLGDGTTRPTD